MEVSSRRNILLSITLTEHPRGVSMMRLELNPSEKLPSL